MEVRCYMFVYRCLARNTRCNIMSHLTADAIFFLFAHVLRATPDATPCHTSPPQGVMTKTTMMINNTHITLHYTTLHYTTLHYTTTILYYTIPYHTIPYHTIPYHTIIYSTILHYTTLYYTNILTSNIL